MKGKENIRSYKELRVFQKAFELAMEIFEITKRFPAEERYSMTDQIRRSSRSVCTNIGEAWRKRRYKAAFISKLSDSETEAAECQIWAAFARRCGYISDSKSDYFDAEYDRVIAQIVTMIEGVDKWLILK